MKIPQELISRKQWVVWKTVTRDGKSTKLPLQPNGQNAKTNDPATWSNFETVALAAKSFDGPGFVFSPDDPYVGIDLDGCRDSSGKVAEWAREIIYKFNSYAEVSPSQTGVKIFVKGEWKDDSGSKHSPDVPSVCEKVPGIEVYTKGRYFAVTGQRLGNISSNIEHRQESLDWLFAKYIAKSSQPSPQPTPLNTDDQIIKRATRYLEKIPGAISGQRGHDRAFHAACVLILGFGLNRQDAYALLSQWNQTCEPPWTQKELEHKLDDAAKQPGERNYLRDKTPEQWDKVSIPRYTQFQHPEVKPVLTVGTMEEAATKYLAEMQSGKKVKLIGTGLAKLDDAIGGGYELGEMIVLAARPSHGKSAFSLQMAHAANSQSLPGILISEEMPKRLIGKRTIQFVSEVPEEDWHSHHVAVGSELFEHFKGRAQTYIVESCITSHRVVEEIEKAVEERGVKFAVVDYAQLLKSDGKTRYEQTTNTSIALRSVASKLGIAVICLCQLSRQIEGRAKFVPTMADLKETGQFEQDADVILALVWPYKVNQKDNPHDYQIFVMKNRNRATTAHFLELKFNPSRQTVLEEKPKFNTGWPDAPRENYGFDD